MHQVRPARNGRGLEGKRLDQARLGLRRRRQWQSPLVVAVEVVEKPDVHAPVLRADERVADDVGGVVVQPQVVERQLERVFRRRDEIRDLVRDVERRLAAVRQCLNRDQAA